MRFEATYDKLLRNLKFLHGGLRLCRSLDLTAKNTTPCSRRASRTGFPPAALDAPSVNDKMNVEVMGPEATPPESKAIAVKSFGVKNVRSIAKA